MKKFFDELYRGRILGWDGNISFNDSIQKKINSENEYFSTILSVEDFKRFKALASLHGNNHAARNRKICVNAFKLGVTLMYAVLTENNGDSFDDEGAEQ
jgi:hypothetical protein